MCCLLSGCVFVVRCLLPVGGSSLFVVGGCVRCCWLVAVCCLLFAGRYCSLLLVYCLLFVV